jgi:hypothetical protein
MGNFKSTKTDGSESLFGEVIFSYTRALPGPFFPLCHEQAESFLRCVLKRFSARNYCIAPRLWQPDFGWDHAGVPLAFSMALTTCSGLFDGIKR